MSFKEEIEWFTLDERLPEESSLGYIGRGVILLFTNNDIAITVYDGCNFWDKFIFGKVVNDKYVKYWAYLPRGRND